MHNILIICDGREIKIQTKRTVEEIYYFIEKNINNELILINDASLCDREFKSEIALAPRKVTLIKDVTQETESRLNLNVDGFKIANILYDGGVLCGDINKATRVNDKKLINV